MKKEGIVIGVLVILLLIGVIAIFVFYNQNNQLKLRNTNLESDRAQLSSDKEALLSERDSLRAELQKVQSKNQMLESDVSSLYKTCITDNICKGHYPGISWKCNNIGDFAEDSVASHTCICDQNCKLNATEIKK